MNVEMRDDINRVLEKYNYRSFGEGYAVESDKHEGVVQIYPEKALM
jgi:hypothetical protein